MKTLSLLKVVLFCCFSEYVYKSFNKRIYMISRTFPLICYIISWFAARHFSCREWGLYSWRETRFSIGNNNKKAFFDRMKNYRTPGKRQYLGYLQRKKFNKCLCTKHCLNILRQYMNMRNHNFIKCFSLFSFAKKKTRCWSSLEKHCSLLVRNNSPRILWKAAFY